jgi:hypothetical protein
VRVAARDRAVLALFRAIRFAETRQLEAVFVPDLFPSYKKLRLRLPRLAAAGLLDRPARRIAPERAEQYRLAAEPRTGGRPQDVWALGDAGARLLGLPGQWNRNNGRLRPSAFPHSLMISRVYCALARAERRGLVAVDWQGENGWRERVRVGGRTLTLVPDATFLLAERTTDAEAPCFLEADNGTEPLTRTDLEQSSFAGKCALYWTYWNEVLRPQRAGMIVLTVAKRRDRAEALRQVAARADPTGRGHGSNLFWFTSEEDWTIAEPETFLYAPIWRTPAGERRALLARAGAVARTGAS